MFLYPLAIVLILLAVSSPWLGTSRWLFGMTTLWTLIPAVLAGVNALPTALTSHGWLHQLIEINRWLPLADLGLGWSVPALIGLLIGLLFSRYLKPTLN